MKVRKFNREREEEKKFETGKWSRRAKIQSGKFDREEERGIRRGERGRGEERRRELRLRKLKKGRRRES